MRGRFFSRESSSFVLLPRSPQDDLRVATAPVRDGRRTTTTTTISISVSGTPASRTPNAPNARRFRSPSSTTAIGESRRGRVVVTMTTSTSNEGRRSWCRYDGNFLTAAEALELDRDLMSGENAQPLEALMRTAGRSAASATLDRTPTHQAFVVLCGPGNNGGDGLVLAREVAMRRLGAEVKVWYPKGPGSSELYAKLVAECEATPNVEFVDEAFVLRAMRERIEGESRAAMCFVDALFGFSFKGAVREPFIDVMKSLTALTNDVCATRDETELFTVSLDIPSGWNVDGAVAVDDDRVFMPNLMISLTAPKRCCATFDDPNLGERHERMKRMATTHVVAGAFLTEKLCDKYDVHAIPLRRDDSKVEYAPLELTRK